MAGGSAWAEVPVEVSEAGRHPVGISFDTSALSSASSKIRFAGAARVADDAAASPEEWPVTAHDATLIAIRAELIADNTAAAADATSAASEHAARASASAYVPVAGAAKALGGLNRNP